MQFSIGFIYNKYQRVNCNLISFMSFSFGISAQELELENAKSFIKDIELLVKFSLMIVILC